MMARGKKKESALTPEEKLAQALVSVEEQPYPVPENWCWARGVSIFKAMETRKPEGEYFDYIDIDAIDNALQVVTEPKHTAVKDAPSRASRAVHYGDTIFSLVRPYLRNIAFIDEPLKDCIASTGFYVCSPTAIVIPRYLYLLMTSSYVVDGLNKYMKGDNSPSIRKDDIELFAYPIPPVEEQKRIVDRIEYLFAKLDEAKEKARSVLDSFETRKAAILHKAFTGELTAKWRKTNIFSVNNQFNNTSEYPYSLPSEWSAVILGELVQIRRGASPRPIKAFITDTIDGINWIKIGDADGSKYITSIKEKVTPAGAKKSVYVEKGTLLLSNSMSFGHPYILEVDGCIHDGWLAILPSVYFDKEFLYYALLFSSWYFEQVAVGTAVRNLNSERVAGTPLPICSIEEQKEIVRILDSLFAKEQQAKEAAEAVLEKIDLLKKSILARAFRGELGTNDPTEESALEPLKTIL